MQPITLDHLINKKLKSLDYRVCGIWLQAEHAEWWYPIQFIRPETWTHNILQIGRFAEVGTLDKHFRLIAEDWEGYTGSGSAKSGGYLVGEYRLVEEYEKER